MCRWEGSPHENAVLSQAVYHSVFVDLLGFGSSSEWFAWHLLSTLVKVQTPKQERFQQCGLPTDLSYYIVSEAFFPCVFMVSVPVLCSHFLGSEEE